MKLASAEGTTVELRPVGYQFPKYSPDPAGGWDWDANWLMIRGDVSVPEGERWSFSAPCMTTRDVRGLGHWLRDATEGDIEPTPDGPSLLMMEPEVAFAVHAFDARTIRLAVYFSLAGAPPSIRESRDPHSEIFEFFVSLSLSRAALTSAIDAWEREIARFPER